MSARNTSHIINAFNFALLFAFQYFTFSVMLVMIGCAVFLQLSTVHKFSMLAVMSTVFIILIRVVYKDLFIKHDEIHFCRWEECHQAFISSL